MSHALKGQGDSPVADACAPVTSTPVSVISLTGESYPSFKANDVTTISDISNAAMQTECTVNLPDTDVDCEEHKPASEPTPSTSDVISVTKIPPRNKKIPRAGKTTSGKPTINTLDNKEFPSCKRKPSGDAGSPSSAQIQKSTRTDGADVVS